VLSLNVTFPTARDVSGSDGVNLYWNVDARALAIGAVSTAKPINSAPLLLFPGVGDAVVWGSTPWGAGPWSGETATPATTFATPDVCWGLVRIAGKAVDRTGNEQAGAIVETTQFVSSTPRPPANLERGTFSAGVQSFTFTPSPQVRL